MALVDGGMQIERGGLTSYRGASAGLGGAPEDFGRRLGVFYAFDLERFFSAPEGD